MNKAHSPVPAAASVHPAIHIGVDVAKAEVVVSLKGQTQAIPNDRKSLKRWLRSLPPACHIAMESTNRYHQLLADLAYDAGHIVYVLNPKQIKHYRTAAFKRAKTDLCDAVLIARFLEREKEDLFPYQPLSIDIQNLNALLHSRATVVKSRDQMRQSLEARSEELSLKQPLLALLNQFKIMLEEMDAQIEELLQKEEIQERAQRLASIVGIGTLTTAALVVAFERADFKTSDALVAFFGFDPKPRDSGQCQGRRHLSKQGDSEVRRLLFNAAKSASLSPVWKSFYERYKKRGFSATQAICILARKLLRVAWSINKHQTTFSREKITQMYANA